MGLAMLRTCFLAITSFNYFRGDAGELVRTESDGQSVVTQYFASRKVKPFEASPKSNASEITLSPDSTPIFSEEALSDCDVRKKGDETESDAAEGKQSSSTIPYIRIIPGILRHSLCNPRTRPQLAHLLSSEYSRVVYDDKDEEDEDYVSE